MLVLVGLSAAGLPALGSRAFDARRVEPSVYKIYSLIPHKNDQFSISSGTGFLVSGQRYVVTNFHVVESAKRYYIAFRSGREAKLVEARVVQKRPSVDLAILEAREDLPGEALTLGEYEPDKLADVVAIGFPGAANLNKLVAGNDADRIPLTDLDSTITTGVVSRMTFTSLKVSDSQTLSVRTVQHSAAINPGNSGGPLFNLKGDVVGINTAIVASGQGIGFAIPINVAKNELEQLKDKGKVTRGWLGVQIQPWEPGLAEKFGLKEERGALVGRVMEGEPAEKAGIQKGDVILEVEGRKIKDTKDLLNTVARLEPGQRAKVVVLRDGKEKTLSVELGERPVEGEVATGPGPAKEDRLGLTIQEVTPEMAERLGLEKPEGVLISNVKPGSPAAKAGLQRGDLIHEVEHQAIRGVKDYQKAISGAGKAGVLFWIQRGKARRYVVVQIGRASCRERV